MIKRMYVHRLNRDRGQMSCLLTLVTPDPRSCKHLMLTYTFRKGWSPFPVHFVKGKEYNNIK